MIKKDKKLKYKNTEIEIQKIPMRKTRSKNIIKGTSTKSAGSRPPTLRCISTIYNVHGVIV